MIKGIIFDLDGTIIDSMQIWSRIDENFLKNHNIEYTEDISHTVKKMTIQESSEFFVEKFSLDMTWQEVSKEIEDMVKLEYYEKIPLKNNVIKLLDYLDKKNIPYGIATATYPDLANAVLKRHNILNRFKFVLTQKEVPAGKNSPDIYLEAMKRLKIDKTGDCMVVEDSLHCVETAENAGFLTVAVKDDFSFKDFDKIDKTADIFVDDIYKITEYLQFEGLSYEPLNQEIFVCKTHNHRFGTDAFLLADFARVNRKQKICDLGTGCGIIPLIWQKKNQPFEIYAVDIQKEAILQLNLGIKRSNITSNIKPILCDIKDLWESAPLNTLDVVTCNPPYKADNSGIQSVIDSQRIARHEILCTIDDICRAAFRLLKEGGNFCLCNRPERLADVIYSLKKNNLEPKRLRFVAKNSHSKPWLFLIEAKKCAKPFLEVMPTLCVYDENNQYTDEMKKIYN